jgi:hypothetical protein
VPRFSTSYRAMDVQRAGGACSAGLLRNDFDISLGLIGVLGVGRALSFNADPDSADTYARTRVKERMLLIFLNGVRSAVNELAKKANERLQDVRKRADEGAQSGDGEREPTAQPEPLP